MKVIDFFKQLFRDRFFPKVVFFSALLLVLIGELFVFSSTFFETKAFFYKQTFWILVGLTIFIIIQTIDFRYLYLLALPLYIISIILLILVLFLGDNISGARRWFSIAGFGLQPSEFAKISTVLMLAYYLEKLKRPFETFKHISIAFLIPAIPALLILKEPDLGTTILFALFTLVMLYYSGIRFIVLVFFILPLINIICTFNIVAWFFFAILLFYLLFISKFQLRTVIFLFVLNIVISIATPVIWNHLHDYQKERILVFLDPNKYKLGAGYHIIQSKVSIGSGGFWGKGILKGTQKKLKFIPEKHTDFIFSVIGEEVGFVGSVFVLLVYFIFFWYSIKLVSETKNKFNQLVLIGFISIIFFQMFINIGMTLGIMPITGIPLPFISYGGSSMLTNFFILGIIVNIGRNRYEY